MSVSVWVPDATVVNALLGSDSQVVTPLKILMYLYWSAVLAGRFTVTRKTGELKIGRRLVVIRLTAPDWVGGRGQDQRRGGGPVLEGIIRSGEVDVL